MEDINIIQKQINEAAIELLSQPQVSGKIRKFGIELNRKLSERDILLLDIPSNTQLYEISGRQLFKSGNKNIIYLLSSEDLDKRILVEK